MKPAPLPMNAMRRRRDAEETRQRDLCISRHEAYRRFTVRAAGEHIEPNSPGAIARWWKARGW